MSRHRARVGAASAGLTLLVATGCGAGVTSPEAAATVGLPSVSAAPAGGVTVGAPSIPVAGVLATAYCEALTAAGIHATCRLGLGSPDVVYRLVGLGRLQIAAEPTVALLGALDPGAGVRGSVGVDLALSRVLTGGVLLLRVSAPLGAAGPFAPLATGTGAATPAVGVLDRIQAGLTSTRLQALARAAARPGASASALARGLLAATGSP